MFSVHEEQTETIEKLSQIFSSSCQAISIQNLPLPELFTKNPDPGILVGSGFL